ncbi:MAG: class I SAM-dependent methyltransferase [Gammaproteobacteria bacterium]|nr:class I SAM-dependent methyltransferase [Gammaproteobacteria bacterium]
MERIPEPELMDDPAQARAYAEADFEAPHSRFIELFAQAFPGARPQRVLDLGCGPGDITTRFARAHGDCLIDGIDGAPAMLEHARRARAAAGLENRIRLTRARLPHGAPPDTGYDTLISNSLLHHLAEPMHLWEALRLHAAPGARIFVMDLMRPQDRAEAGALVEAYAAGEPDVLRRDLYNSLLAAFRPEEVEAQLARAGMALEVAVVSDRHLLVRGQLAA